MTNYHIAVFIARMTCIWYSSENTHQNAVFVINSTEDSPSLIPQVLGWFPDLFAVKNKPHPPPPHTHTQPIPFHFLTRENTLICRYFNNVTILWCDEFSFSVIPCFIIHHCQLYGRAHPLWQYTSIDDLDRSLLTWIVTLIVPLWQYHWESHVIIQILMALTRPSSC